MRPKNDDQKGSKKENDDQPFTENSQKILDDKLEIDESSHVGAASPGIFFPDESGWDETNFWDKTTETEKLDL